jgi:hypothetical protein
MKKKTLLTWLLIVILGSNSFAQEPLLAKKKRKINHVSIAFTNSHTAMPFTKFSKLFTGNYHPGLEVSTGFNWKTKQKHDWIQDFDFGYSYHRWVQHSLVLYTELGYRHKFPAGFAAQTMIGGGYMRAIVATQTFSDGVEKGRQYSKISSGRSQCIASWSLAISKKISHGSRSAIFLQYQQRFQMPFIPSYVPLLPYNIMKAGVSVTFKK